MLKILKNSDISYTKGDTFSLKVKAKNGFLEGSTLRLIIAESENKEPLIERTYQLSGDVFNVNLTEMDKRKLELSSYIYKLSVISAEGAVITQKSGDFLVKWGA